MMTDMVTNACAKFNCDRLRIDKALGIENLTTIIVTKKIENENDVRGA